jgi:hypothetical protein
MSARQMMAHLLDGIYQVTKPESLILQRYETISASAQPAKADKESASVGIARVSQQKLSHLSTGDVQLTFSRLNHHLTSRSKNLLNRTPSEPF